ncbi:MAG: hypothetical protein Q4D79_02200 [Propionibacteriaceae bacterium]|nr:hypothetical protein [Propionibacteriaceae bacterium]
MAVFRGRPSWRWLGALWGLTWRTSLGVSVAFGAQWVGRQAGWLPMPGVPSDDFTFLTWLYLGVSALTAAALVHFLWRRHRLGLGEESLAAVGGWALVLAAAFAVLLPGGAYMFIWTALLLGLVAAVPQRARPVAALVAAFGMVAVVGPMSWMLFELLKELSMFTAVWFVLAPVAPLALVCLSTAKAPVVEPRSPSAAPVH